MNKSIIKMGVIGGLGPLASASFVETIYTIYLREVTLKKQVYLPYVCLYSEPLLSQATSIMSIKPSEAELLDKLERNIAQFVYQGIDRIVICCFTAHALLPRLLPLYQAKICSLVTQVLEHVFEQKTQFILLCASSARVAQVFECHPLWPKTAQQITFVEDEIQTQLDWLIGMVKKNQVNSQVLDDFLALMNHYSICQFIIACAELHVLYKAFQAHFKTQVKAVFDPFVYLTQMILDENK